MKMRNYRMISIFLIVISEFLSGCGDMPHSNPLDPKNPDYKPPMPPTFTSIAIQGDKAWFGSTGGGLLEFDGFKWSKYTKTEGMPDNYIEAVIAQGDNIWFTISGQNQKIFSFKNQRVKEYSVPSIVSLSANENHIWIGSENEIGTYDPGKDSMIWYQLPAGGQVIALLWDDTGVWVAIQKSIDKTKSVEVAKFDPQTMEWFSAGYLPMVNGEILLAIALDGDILWFGTSRGDIRQFQLSEKAASRTSIGICPAGLWKTNGCIAADESFVWFGYGGRGLIRYHKIVGRRESFFDGEMVYGIAITDEYVWAVTDTGAHRYEKQTGIWTQYKYPKFDVEEPKL